MVGGSKGKRLKEVGGGIKEDALEKEIKTLYFNLLKRDKCFL